MIFLDWKMRWGAMLDKAIERQALIDGFDANEPEIGVSTSHVETVCLLSKKP